MPTKPLVSIITPCYNGENFLDRYLKKILDQTYDNIQLIIVNDGSTDNTIEILNGFIESFKKRGYTLKIINQENQGLGGAINTGLKHIEGEYFTWCDSDNYYTNDYVEENVKFFKENPKFSIVRCDGFIVKSDNLNKIVGYMCNSENEKTEENMFLNCLYEKNFHFGCAMLKTKDFDSINPYREIYPSREGQNWQLLLPMFYHYLSGYIDKKMFFFVYRADSVSNRTKLLGFDKQIEQKEEYETIVIKTLKNINMPDEEREKYVFNVQKKYLKEKFMLSCYYNKYDGIEKYYKLLEENDLVDRKIKFAYFRSKHKFINFIYKICRLPFKAIRKFF